MRNWYKFFLLAVSTLTEAAKNLYQSRCIVFIANLLYIQNHTGKIITMNKLLRQYPYGFAFSELKFDNLPDSYKSVRVLNKFNYYYDTYKSLYECDGSFVIIHGHFKFVGKNNDEDIENHELPRVLLDNYINNKIDFLELLDFIGGRYVIIIGNSEYVEAYPDACMCRSVYYTSDRNILASHVEMIVDNYSYEKDPVIEQASRISFNLTKSPYLGIKSLLPNISVELMSKSTQRFFPRDDNKYKKLDEESKFELIEKLWKGQLQHYVENYENLVFSITAGSDSRVSFSMAKCFKDKIKFFTYAPSDSNDKSDSYFIKTLSIDKNVVSQFSKDIDFNHRFLIFGDNNKVLTEEEVNVLNKNTVKIHGRFLLKHYIDSFPENDVMHIRANLLEIGRAHFLNNDKPSNIDSVKNVYDFHLKSYIEVLSKESLDAIFYESIKDFHYDGLYDYHLLDLYYWENRMGRWFSEVLNETDSAFDTMLPYNMRAIIDISLSFNLEKRRDDYMFKELVNRNFPILNFYGRNVVENVYEQQRDKKYGHILVTKKADVYNDMNKKIVNFYLDEDVLYLPKDFIKKDYYSEVEIIFNEKYGIAEIEVESRFASANAENYLRYEVLVNDEVRIQEDMSKWKFSNKICLMSLMKNDSIKLRVIALRTTPQGSWQKASQLKMLSYNEKLIDQYYPAHTSCTSPFSIINNGL